MQNPSRTLAKAVLGAALRSRKIGPFKAEYLAHPFNRARVEFVAIDKRANVMGV